MFKLLFASAILSNPISTSLEVANKEQKNIVYQAYQETINLSSQQMNPVSIDLSYIDPNSTINELKQAIDEAVIIETVVENFQYDWINDFMYSILYDEPHNWNIVGLNYKIPEPGTQKLNKVRFVPKNVTGFTGVMAIDVTLQNGEVNQLKNLSEDLQVTDLGEIKDNKESTIISSLKSKNPNLITEEIILTDITKNSATIRVKNGSKIYKDAAIGINYKLRKEKMNLQEHLQNTNLGEINSNNSNEILQAVKNKNPEVETNELYVSNITDNSAKVIVKSDSKIYNQYEINVLFTLPNHAIDLSKLEGDIGKIKTPNDKAIIFDKLDELNKNGPILNGNRLDRTKLKIIDINYNTATLVSTDSKTYKGELRITFNYDIVVGGLDLYTDEANVEAYNSTQLDEKSNSYTYSIKGDENNFLNAYNYVTLDLKGYNDTKSKSEDRVSHKFDVSLKLKLQNTKGKEVAYAEYMGSTNWNKAWTTIDIEIQSTQIEFTIRAHAKAYAKASNTHWSRAWSKITLDTITFTKD